MKTKIINLSREGYILNPYTGNEIKENNSNGIKLKQEVDKILKEFKGSNSNEGEGEGRG